MSTDKYVRRLIRAMGVEFPTPREVPDLLAETPQQLLDTAPGAKTDGAIAKTLFDVMGEGLVESKLAAGQAAISGNLTGMRAWAAHIMAKIGADAALDTLIYDRLARAGSVPVPANGPTEPDTEMGILTHQRNERLFQYNKQMNQAVAERRRLCQGYSATPECIAADQQYFSVKKTYDLVKAQPITRPAPVAPPPPPTDPGIDGRRRYVFWMHQINFSKWQQDKSAWLVAARNANAMTTAQYSAMLRDPNHPVMRRAEEVFGPQHDQFVKPLVDELAQLDIALREGTYPVGSPQAAPYAAWAHFAGAWNRAEFDKRLGTWKGA